jgi:chemotaxis protein methyltransferase CheR
MTFNRQPAPQDARSSAPESAAVMLLSPEQFGRLRDLLAGYSGVYLDATRQRVLEAGLARRLDTTGDDLASYERRIQMSSGREELRMLAELVLNHETMFFRNGPHLRALREVLLPEIQRRKPAGEPIRFWSAGCATGEEAYSLAITALETLGPNPTNPIEIWATDLSQPALHKARAGYYRGRSLQNAPADILARYFHPHGDGYIVNDALRSLVRFEALNLLDPFPQRAHGADIIFCQNVTIYFQLKTCQRLIERFYDCLPNGGLLCLGFSETLWNIFDRFHSREVRGAYVYYKGASVSPAPAKGQHSRETQPLAAPAKPERRQSAPRTGRAGNSARPSVTRDANRQFHDHADHNDQRGQPDDLALQRGREFLASGRIQEAIEALRRIPPQSPYAQQALTLAARAHADRGDLDLAAAEVQRSLEINTLNEEAYLLLGMIYGRQGQWQSAIEQLERARYLNPESALVSFHLAEAYRQATQAEKAAREYRNTLRKLDAHPPGELLDGVAVGWLRETCQRQLEYPARRT